MKYKVIVTAEAIVEADGEDEAIEEAMEQLENSYVEPDFDCKVLDDSPEPQCSMTLAKEYKECNL